MSPAVAVVAIAAVAVLGIVLCVAFVRLYDDMRQAEREARGTLRLIERYGGSLTWNDETPASLDGGRGSDATPRMEG